MLTALEQLINESLVETQLSDNEGLRSTSLLLVMSQADETMSVLSMNGPPRRGTESHRLLPSYLKRD